MRYSDEFSDLDERPRLSAALAALPADIRAEFWGDEGLALSAVRAAPWMVGEVPAGAPFRARAEDLVATAICELNPYLLRNLPADSPRRGDLSFVQPLLNWQPMVLQYCSAEVRGRRDIVFPLVQRYWMVLREVAPPLQEDPELIAAGIRQDADALQFAGPTLLRDIAFLRQHACWLNVGLIPREVVAQHPELRALAEERRRLLG